MTGFDETKLGDVLTFQRGFDITKSEQSEGHIPIVSSSGISSYHNKAKVKGPGVVIGRKGTLGTVHFLKGDFWPHDTTLWIKDFKGNDPRFLSYFLPALKLENFDVGAANPTLNRNHVHGINVFFPRERRLQEKIAAILSAYDELIENHRRRIALLEKLAEEIYREWFVRLRFPGHEKVKFLKGRPETWAERKFGNFCVLQRGHDLPDANVVPGPYPIIASTSIKGYHHDFKALPPVVTTGRSGSLGTVLMTHTKAWPLNTALYVKDFCGNSAFLVYYTLKNMGLEKFNAGAGVPTLNRNHLTGIKINVPDTPIQKRFDEMVGPIHDQKEQIVKMNEVLRQTRDLLLPRLISGKLSVEDLDIQFPPGMQSDSELSPTHDIP